VNDGFSEVSVLVVLVAVLLGLLRVLRGPTRADRMLAAQLFGTAGVAVLVLLASALGRPAILDAALVLALLTAVAVIAFTRLVWIRSRGPETRHGSR